MRSAYASDLLERRHQPLAPPDHTFWIKNTCNISVCHIIVQSTIDGSQLSINHSLWLERLPLSIGLRLLHRLSISGRGDLNCLNKFPSDVNEVPKTLKDIKIRLPLLIDVLNRTKTQAGVHHVSEVTDEVVLKDAVFDDII